VVTPPFRVLYKGRISFLLVKSNLFVLDYL
jgi:hypothetical protein